MSAHETRVLIIDDDAHLRETLAEALDLEGYLCMQAGTAKEGLDAAKTRNPRVVICDIQLPDSSGFQICQDLRKFSRQMVVILMSGRFLSSEEKTQGFSLGADEYLTKPFDIKGLSVRIRQLLGRAPGR